MNLRRALAAAAATATLLALAGCGGDETRSEKASDPSAASASASSGETEDSVGSGSSDAPSDGQELTGPEFAQVLQGALEKATTAHVTMDLGGSAGSAEGDADYTATPPEMAMTMSMDALGGEVEMRLVDNTMYMKSPTFGEKWVAFPLDDPSNPLGALGDQLDMTKQLETFAGAVTSATYTGADEVDGESLDHYTATVDTEKMLQDLPSEMAGQAGLPDTMTQEWWFDGDGLIRSFSTDFGGVSTSMTLSDWGADVDIEAPPADQVTTMPGTTAG